MDTVVALHVYVDQDSKNLKWWDLTSLEKLRLFKAIKIVFSKAKIADKIQQLWNDFKTIHDTLWSDMNAIVTGPEKTELIYTYNLTKFSVFKCKFSTWQHSIYTQIS